MPHAEAGDSGCLKTWYAAPAPVPMRTVWDSSRSKGVAMSGNVCCRLCAIPYVQGGGFYAAEVWLYPILKTKDILLKKDSKERPQAYMFCPACFEQFVKPAAELHLLPDYRRRIAKTILLTLAPALGTQAFLMWLAMTGALSVPVWLLSLFCALAFIPALILIQWILPRVNERYFGAQFSPLKEKLDLGSEVMLSRVKAQPAP